jgi:hypothetical protein
LASFQKRGSPLVKGRFSEGLMDRFLERNVLVC